MNLKKAKALRKEAAKAAGGVVPRKYEEGNKGMRLVHDGANEDGTPKLKPVAITGTVRLDKGCTRAVYKALKRAA